MATTRKGANETMSGAEPGREFVAGDEFDALFEAEEAEGWRPEIGDSVRGEIMSISTGGIGSKFGAYPILTIKQMNGEFIKVHAFHFVLRNTLRAKEVGEGDTIGIKYLGEVPGEGKDDFGYENYTVVLKRKPGQRAVLKPEAQPPTVAPPVTQPEPEPVRDADPEEIPF